MQVYCVQHFKDASHPRGRRVEVKTVALQEPDTDSHNGVIFLGLPATVVHKVDFSSPLAPDAPLGTVGHPEPFEVKKYLRKSPYLEILVLFSGQEDATSCNIEARHSYTLDDIFWDMAFVTCVSIDAEGYHCVDYDKLHMTVPVRGSDSPTLIHRHSCIFNADLDGYDSSPSDSD